MSCDFMWVVNVTGHCGKEGEIAIEDAASRVMAELAGMISNLLF